MNCSILEKTHHNDLMSTICQEIINVCWCHGCGKRKYLGNNYAGEFCKKSCYNNILDITTSDYNEEDDFAQYFNSWCKLGQACIKCVYGNRYTLACQNNIQHWNNLDPMGAKNKRYTSLAKPKIRINYDYSNTDYYIYRL